MITRIIPLTQGKEAIIDEQDWSLIAPYTWYAHGRGRSWHARAADIVGERGSSSRPLGIYMHRLILGIPRGDKRQVDHINRNGLDNRRCNIRVATHSQNMHNRPVNPFSKTGIKLVHRRENGVYFVRLRLGPFKSAEEATQARDEAWEKLGYDPNTM